MAIDEEKLSTILEHNISEIYPSKEALADKLSSGALLTIYLGIDPTIPDVHLGHGVIYKKLEDLRQLGHKVILLVGDFTAKIGDPTDQTSARVQMTEEQVAENAQLYKEQISKVLNFDDPENPAVMRFNSEWLSPLTFSDLINLSANFTLQQMVERDMFQERLKENKPIYMHEFFYPFMQGYDSVAMDVDIEIGGTDQTFNMLAGRDLMKKLRNKEKFVITCEFLMGLDGKKMSKSKGNFISLRDDPFEMYRKVMTIHDDMIEHYFDMIFNDRSELVLSKIQHNPMSAKKDLAARIVEWIHGQEQAASAATAFEQRVQKGDAPEEVKEASIPKNVLLVDFMIEHKLTDSKSEARRLIEQGGVSLSNIKINDINYVLTEKDKTLLLKVGKANYTKLL